MPMLENVPSSGAAPAGGGAVTPGEHPPRPGALVRLLAWGVHFYTALGLVAAAGMAVLIVRGDTTSLLWVFVLMVVATVIDATDGFLARAIRIKQVLPGFDGALLDNIIDYLTYTFLPMLLLWRAELIPADWAWFWLIPLLASVYGFCQTQAKTPDNYFIGFPSLWNGVAFYLYVLQPPPWLTVGLVALLSFLTFVPSRYLYPSKAGGMLSVVANVLGAAWVPLLAWILVRLLMADPNEALTDPWTRTLVLVSLVYPAFYLGASWVVTVRHNLTPPAPLP